MISVNLQNAEFLQALIIFVLHILFWTIVGCVGLGVVVVFLALLASLLGIGGGDKTRESAHQYLQELADEARSQGLVVEEHDTIGTLQEKLGIKPVRSISLARSNLALRKTGAK